MTNSKTTRKALLSSALALTMCVAMLIATTFAWFTDTASTSVNKIQAGKLDVSLEMKNPEYTGADDTNPAEWISAEGQTLGWVKATGDGTTSLADSTDILWEPGCTYNLQDVRVVNNGDLALKYQVQISGLLGNAELLNAIDFTVKIGDGDETKLANWDETLEAGEKGDAITITGTMKSDAGNEYQGLSIDGIAITVVATQLASEFDSNSNDYDEGAVLPVSAKAVGNLTVEKTESGETVKVKTEQTLSDNVMSVTYPANVVLSTDVTSSGTDGTKKSSVTQELKYVGTEARGESVEINDETQAVASYDLTLPVANENTTLVTVEINYTKGLNIEKIYHDGEELTKVTEEPSSTTGAECFMYDKDRGVITLYLKHASPIDIVYGKPGVTSKEGKSLNDVFGGTDFDFGYGNTSTEAVTLDGKGTAVVTDYVDGWFASDVTIKGVTFRNGVCFTAKNDGTTGAITFEDCTFYACDQSKIDLGPYMSNSLKNSGDGLCLNVDTKNSPELEVVVKDCTFIGENDETLDRNGWKDMGGSGWNAETAVRDRARGHAVMINGICGGGNNATAESVLIEDCTMSGIRGHAIQLYTLRMPVTIKDCKINSWGKNKQTAARAKEDAAIRGGIVTGTEGRLTLTNNYFGLQEESSRIKHVEVDNFSGNTDGTRAAGTYSYQAEN